MLRNQIKKYKMSIIAIILLEAKIFIKKLSKYMIKLKKNKKSKYCKTIYINLWVPTNSNILLKI
jgi:hypothetical protein